MRVGPIACRVTVESGKLLPEDFDAWCSALNKFAGKVVYVSFDDKKRQPEQIRGNASNRFLWGAIYGAIAAETGNDPQTVHEGCKREAVRVGVLPHNLIPMGDKFFEIEPTTVQDEEIHRRYRQWLIEGCESGSLCGMRIHIEVGE